MDATLNFSSKMFISYLYDNITSIIANTLFPHDNNFLKTVTKNNAETEDLNIRMSWFPSL